MDMTHGVAVIAPEADPAVCRCRHRRLNAVSQGTESPLESTMESDNVMTLPRVREEKREKTRKQPRYHVILLDDNDHTYDYVIRMVQEVFGHNQEQAFRVAREVDEQGRVILLTTTKEHAEFKQEQIHGYGADPLIPRSKGSMWAVIEPAPE